VLVRDVDQLSSELESDGIPDARAETSYFRTDGRVHLTCKAPIAEVLLEDLRAANRRRDDASGRG
jgi:hypothetical protein